MTGGLGYLPAANALGHNAIAGDPNATTIGVHVTRAVTIAPSSSGGGTSATFPTDLSTLIAYVEMLLIRWIGTEIRVFAYLQNAVLVPATRSTPRCCSWAPASCSWR